MNPWDVPKQKIHLDCSRVDCNVGCMQLLSYKWSTKTDTFNCDYCKETNVTWESGCGSMTDQLGKGTCIARYCIWCWCDIISLLVQEKYRFKL